MKIPLFPKCVAPRRWAKNALHYAEYRIMPSGAGEVGRLGVGTWMRRRPAFDLLGIILRTSSCDQPSRKEKN